ncbi:MAG: hypothetical protein PWP60_924 [Candidatus Atribacteria bacterium]|nr:hypothetical protein [Candidatus Atribacteria bacterium]
MIKLGLVGAGRIGRLHAENIVYGIRGAELVTVADTLLNEEMEQWAYSLGDPRKAKRPIAAILKYLTLTVDHILAAFPPGTVPPVEKVTLRTEKEMEPFLKEPGSPGWKSVYELPYIGVFHKL